MNPVCARPGCGEPVIPWLNATYCSRGCAAETAAAAVTKTVQPPMDAMSQWALSQPSEITSGE